MRVKVKVIKSIQSQKYVDKKTGGEKIAQKCHLQWDEECAKWDGSKYTVQHETVATVFCTNDEYLLREGCFYDVDLRFSVREYEGSKYTQCSIHACRPVTE